MNDTEKYTVNKYIHGAELVAPDGEEIAMFAHRYAGERDGDVRAQKVCDLLNEALELRLRIMSADQEIASLTARDEATEKELRDLRAKVARYEAAFKAANGTEAANE